MQKVTAILLFGGKGERMKSSVPKQYLMLNGKPIALHSLDAFIHHPEITEVVVVADTVYHEIFSSYEVIFAQPGKRRQDSVYNGLQKSTYPWICIHDGARPFVSKEMISRLIITGKKVGAAATGMPLKWTIKETDKNGCVIQTHERENFWEIQTPQFLSKKVLEKGFDFAISHGLSVTDDVQLAELIGHPVQIINGCHSNIKITTPEDLVFASNLLTSTSGL